MENDSSDDNGLYGLFVCDISTPFAAISGIDVSFLYEIIVGTEHKGV